MSERVPVEDVLGILRAEYSAMPELDGSAGADRLPSHRQQDDRLQGEEDRNDQDKGPRGDALGPQRGFSPAPQTRIGRKRAHAAMATAASSARSIRASLR